MDNKWNIGEGGEMPIGFGLALAANAKSMEAFAMMSENEKEATVERSRQMHTKADMERFVNRLGEQLSGSTILKESNSQGERIIKE